MIHLQGMGIIGSGIAWTLNNRGIPFTWSDTDADITAWKSCTGAIYPSGDPKDLAGYLQWVRWAATAPWPWATIVEQANYWYCTKQPPHSYKGEPLETVGPLKCHPLPSFHLNAQSLVPLTRDWFRMRRRLRQEPGDQLIITHGFNDRLERYVWGWSRFVELDTSALGVGRACVYLRPSLVVMAYAFPTPNTHLHYAGSALLVQKTAVKRNPLKDYDRWEQRWTELTSGLIPIKWKAETILQGWRPSTGPVGGEAILPLWERRADGTLVVMPLWHSGVRWLPVVVNELLEHLEIGDARKAGESEPAAPRQGDRPEGQG